MHGFRTSVRRLGLFPALMNWRSTPQLGDIFLTPPCMTLHNDSAVMRHGNQVKLTYDADLQVVKASATRRCTDPGCTENEHTSPTFAILTCQEDWTLFVDLARRRRIHLTATAFDPWLGTIQLLPDQPTARGLRFRRNRRRLYAMSFVAILPLFFGWLLLQDSEEEEEASQPAAAR